MDPNSNANWTQVETKHFDLDLQVDFDAHVLRGHVIHHMMAIAAVDEVHLDTKDVKLLQISWRLNAQSDWHSLVSWSLGPVHACFGQLLRISLPEQQKQGAAFELKVEYETKPECSAVQWLKPEQTAGKLHPYLFTQCQAIHARTMMPCQDTPAVKATYTSVVRVPKPLHALMSALSKGDPEIQGQTLIYSFEQKTPIPVRIVT